MSFQQGLSGLNAAAKNLDVVGNNVANSSTVGFKSAQAHFADVFANSLGSSGGTTVGIGVAVGAVDQSFSQGNISTTDNPLDLAISGKGFFRMSNNGAVTFGRNGQFQLDKNGYIINDSGARLTGYLPNANGALVTAAPSDLQIISGDIAPRTTTEVDPLLNFDSRSPILASAAFDMNNPLTFTNATSVATYDTLGNAHSLALYFVKSAVNTWDVFGANDGTQLAPAAPALATDPLGTVSFLSNGSINPATTTFPSSIDFPVTTGAVNPMPVTLDFTGTTQFGSIFGVNQLAQDGFTSGRLSGYNVSGDGVIVGRYTNGQTKTLGQVALADFTDPQSLQPLSNNVWAETSQSGPPLVGVPNSGPLGLLQSGAVEDSNVDLTAELVNMITAQRFYQANAQTIKTQDAVMQTLVNLR